MPVTTRRRRARRLAAIVLAPLLGGLLSTALAGCGDSPSQLAVAVTAQPSNTVLAGSSRTFTIDVVNKGPGAASGVRVSLDLTGGFTYQATPAIDKDPIGAVRLQDQDPPKDSPSPSWGTWSLDPPTRNADGSARRAYVSLHVTLRAGSAPGDFSLTPRASDDSVDGDVGGEPLTMHVAPASAVNVELSVTPRTVHRNQDVLYRVVIDNLGSGPAAGLSILITLPPGLDFLRTEQIQGNASRNRPVDPIPGSLLVYYGGFTVPAKTSAGPGTVVITLRARDSFATGGQFTTSVQVTDATGKVLRVKDGAPITITAPGAPPTPTPVATAPPPPPSPDTSTTSSTSSTTSKP